MKNNEILFLIHSLSSEKGLERENVFEAMEAALASATRKKLHDSMDVRCKVNREDGSFETFRCWEVVTADEEELDLEKQLLLEQAQQRKPDAQIGDFVLEPMPSIVFGRIEAQIAKLVLLNRVRESEREHTAARFEKRINTMLSGFVRRVHHNDYIIDIDGAEAILPKNKSIHREVLRPNDRIRVILEDVRPSNRGPQLFLSRISPRLLIELFKLEVPEINEGIIEIKGASRDPGMRAKLAVSSTDRKIDPIGACVGIRGSRVQSVSNEINGERVDIIQWSDDPAEFAIEAIKPAEVESLLIDEESHSIDIIVDESQLSQAIGKGGQNVRLASELMGWELNLMTEVQAQEKEKANNEQSLKLFVEELNVDQSVASILVQEGYTRPSDLLRANITELLAIEEFDETLAQELVRRAQEYEDEILSKRAQEAQKLEEAKPELLQVEGVDEAVVAILQKNGILTREDLADQSLIDLKAIAEMALSEDRLKQMIMSARSPLFTKTAATQDVAAEVPFEQQ